MSIRSGMWLVVVSLGSACAGDAVEDGIGHDSEPLTSVTWTDTVGVLADGNDLAKTSSLTGWNAGAESVETLSGDGYVEFTTLENTTAKMAGLSWAWHFGDASDVDVDFAIYLRSDGIVSVREKGVARGEFGPYVAGDVFRVQVVGAACVGGVVTYWRNGTLLRTSAARPWLPLLVDTSLHTPGATIVDAVLETEPFWTAVVGAAADGTDLARGTNAGGWTAGANSIATLPGDGYAEFSTLENTTAKMAGLSNGNGGTGYEDIDFALYLKADGTVGIREGGLARGSFGAYAAGDVFRVQVLGGVVTYWRNGALLRTSTATPTFPLLFDSSLRTPGATIVDAVLEAEPFWTAVVGASADGNNLSRATTTAGWAGGASSIATLSGDGYAVFTIGDNTTAKMAGLSSGDDGTGYQDIDFAIYLRADGTFSVREAGVSRGGFGAYAAGDVFRIMTVGGVVTYARNGVVFYTSGQAPTFPLLFDTSLRTPGATILDARLVSIGDVPVFDNGDQTFVWRPTTEADGAIMQVGAFLDLTRPATEQVCVGTLAGVEFFRAYSGGNITPGSVRFRSWRNPQLPPRGARLAAGEDVLVEWDGSTYRYTPPLAKAPGDVVGPDDRWVFGDPTYPTSGGGVIAEHFQDPCGCESPPDQRWFDSGIVGVQFDAIDGVHYGFVEIEWIPSSVPNQPEQDNYIAVRWGYNPVAGAPLVIPP